MSEATKNRIHKHTHEISLSNFSVGYSLIWVTLIFTPRKKIMYNFNEIISQINEGRIKMETENKVFCHKSFRSQGKIEILWRIHVCRCVKCYVLYTTSICCYLKATENEDCHVKTCANSFYHIIFFNFATWIWYYEVTIWSMEKSLQKMLQIFQDFCFCPSLYFYAQNEQNFYCKLCSQTISHSVWNLKYIACYTAILLLHLQWFVITRMWNVVKWI